MRTEQTRRPSFPNVESDTELKPKDNQVWQVLCGDLGQWRVGLYSPEFTKASECEELEQHDCPEFFILLEGRLTLLLAKNREVVELELQAGKPVLVNAPHSGFCPDGPHSGKALVVERDAFDTIYDTAERFTLDQTLTFNPVDK
jgi:hypothetical protein